ncbi:MAG TPA: 50S ribosomal protein L4, partial [Bacteroidales bacterium]|nr:50S ribosomal protein L4 [Bacteroidales bacterium]
KTKKYIDVLKSFNLLDKKTLLVLSESNKNIYMSSRNLQKAKVTIPSNLNTYDILNAHNILFVESALIDVEKQFSKSEEVSK